MTATPPGDAPVTAAEEEVHLKQLILQQFAKSGAWALLSLLLLTVVWYELDRWAADYVKAQREFISLAASNLTAQSRTLESMAVAIQQMGDYPQRNYSAIEELARSFDRAHELMKDSPARSTKMLETLQEIEQQMKTLNMEFASLRTTIERFIRDHQAVPESPG
jgi:predicted  nucleic acid-binding Zn-ribbon protein